LIFYTFIDCFLTKLDLSFGSLLLIFNSWSSFLAVYTMLLGEVDETKFGSDNTIAIILFVVFMFLVVILLANVLIAIVTDSYTVIRDKRAAIVFWMNRLVSTLQMLLCCV